MIPAVLMGTNNQSKVPLLIGHNADEGLFFASGLAQDTRGLSRSSSVRDFPQNSLTQCSRGIRQRQTPRSQWRRRCWTASHDSSRPRYSRLARFRKSAMSTCIGFRVSRRPAARPGEAPRIPPKSRTSSTTRMGTPHSSKRSIAPCRARWPTRGCGSRRQGIQTVAGCLNGLRTALLTIDCSISATA